MKLYTIKPLEWKDRPYQQKGQYAQSVLGIYTVVPGEIWRCICPDQLLGSGVCDTLEQGKQAAQEHFEKRMAEGLVPAEFCVGCGNEGREVIADHEDCQGVPLCKACYDCLDPEDCDCPKHRPSTPATQGERHGE